MSTGDEEQDRQAAGAAQYRRFDSGAEFQQSVETLLDLSGRELRIFDPDMEGWRLNSVERVDHLQRFLQVSRTRRLYLVVHDTGHITRYCPRMLQLLARYNHVISINRTDESVRSLQDSLPYSMRATICGARWRGLSRGARRETKTRRSRCARASWRSGRLPIRRFPAPRRALGRIAQRSNRAL